MIGTDGRGVERMIVPREKMNTLLLFHHLDLLVSVEKVESSLYFLFLLNKVLVVLLLVQLECGAG
jgi:hypothetical protein